MQSLYILIGLAFVITLVLLFILSQMPPRGGAPWGYCPDGTPRADRFGSNCRWGIPPRTPPIWWEDRCRGKFCRHGCDPRTGRCYDVSIMGGGNQGDGGNEVTTQI